MTAHPDRSTDRSTDQTTDRSNDRLALHVHGAAELLAVVPYLLGYHPAGSLVTIAVHGTQLLNIARVDLATTAAQLATLRPALQQLATVASAHQATGAILIGYGPAEHVDPNVNAAMEALTELSIPIEEALRADADHYWSYLCDNGLLPTRRHPVRPQHQPRRRGSHRRRPDRPA